MNNYQQLTNTLLNGLNSQYTSKRSIVTVNGLQEAKNYNLDRGENIILMDSNEDIVYIKSCEETGKYILKVYRCEDITETFTMNDTEVNKKDFNKLSEEVAELKTMLKGVLKNEYNVSKKQRDEKPVS